MKMQLRVISYIVAFFGVLLLFSMLGFTIIPDAISIIAIFILSVVLSILGTRYNIDKKKNS